MSSRIKGIAFMLSLTAKSLQHGYRYNVPNFIADTINWYLILVSVHQGLSKP